jgi:hypothetical protein
MVNQKHPVLAVFVAVLVAVGGFLVVASGGRTPERAETNLWTHQGPVQSPTPAVVNDPANPLKPATRLTPPQPVVVLGDSTGEFLGRSMATYNGFNVDVRALRRCPLRPGTHNGRMYPGAPDGDWGRTDEGATYADESCGWRDYIDKINLSWAWVYIFAGPMMLTDMDDGNVLTNPETITAEMRDLVEALYARGTSRVILVTPPLSKAAYGHDDMYWLDPERNDAWTAILRDVAAGVPGEHATTCLLEYAEWAAGQPDPRDDGAHMGGPEGQRHAGWLLGSIQERRCQSDEAPVDSQS